MTSDDNMLTKRRGAFCLYVPAVVFLVFFIISRNGGLVSTAHASPGQVTGPEALTHLMVMVTLQLAVIIAGAKLMGEFFDRVLKQPAVLGELAAGLRHLHFRVSAAVVPRRTGDRF